MPSTYPIPGSPRPMQRGDFLIPTATGQVDVTISAVDPTKAALAVNGWYVSNTASLGANNETALLWEIVNATTIRFSRPTVSGGSPAIAGKWELRSWN